MATGELATESLGASEAAFIALFKNYLRVHDHGANIASAATLNLDTATGDLIDVTGNTGISAVTLSDGESRMVRFTGTPTINVGASLIGNGGGADITAAAGDMAMFRGYALGVVRFWLFRLSGKPTVLPGAADIGAGTFGTSGSAFSFPGTTTLGANAARAWSFSTSGPATARYDDSGVVVPFTMQNTGISGANQGAELRVVLGLNGTDLNNAARLLFQSSDTFAASGNRSVDFILRLMQAGTDTERFRVKADGTLQVSGSEVIDSGRLLVNRSSALSSLQAGAAGKQQYASDLGGGGNVLIHDGGGWKRAGNGGQATVSTDAAFTLAPLTSTVETRHTGTLTANRAITLSTTGARAGDRFRVTRTGSGAFNLDFGGLKNLATNTWAEAVYDGAAWYLAAYGGL